MIQAAVRQILTSEARALFNVPVGPEYATAVSFLWKAKGKILTTGMGKAGLAARKCASTLCTTGTPAVFVHPGEAAHGEAGVVAFGDVLVVFSTSGRTREVEEFVAQARALGVARVVVVTTNQQSPIGAASDVVLGMGEVHEPCPLGLTPSASTTVMMAIGDALAFTLMSLRGFTREEFGLRHHGGYLGEATR